MDISLHQKNQGFTWEGPKSPLTRISQKQRDQYDSLGYFLLENVFSSEELEPLIAAIDPFEEASEKMLREKFGGSFFIAKADAITFTTHIVTKSEIAKNFSQHPVFQDICHDIIGEGARLYWDQAVYKKPGNPEEFPWHQDNGYTFTEPQQYLTCWVPLNHATAENGCPWIVPGLHKRGTLAHEHKPLGLTCLENPEESICVEAKAGDVVVFSSLTPHRTGPNLTKSTRKSYILQYAPDGAVVHQLDGSVEDANNPDRQYFVSEEI